jgi:hypothetical protein
VTAKKERDEPVHLETLVTADAAGEPAEGQEADEAIPAPKGYGPPDPAAFPLQTSRFKGPPEGDMIAIVDPQASRP